MIVRVVPPHAEYIAEMRRREEAQGITPDPVIDAFLHAAALEGHPHSVTTDLMLRILGLEICAETQIGNDMIRGVSGGQKKRVTTGQCGMLSTGWYCNATVSSIVVPSLVYK